MVVTNDVRLGATDPMKPALATKIISIWWACDAAGQPAPRSWFRNLAHLLPRREMSRHRPDPVWPSVDDIKQSEPRLNERKPQRGGAEASYRGALGRVRTQLAKTTERLFLNVPLFASNFMYDTARPVGVAFHTHRKAVA